MGWSHEFTFRDCPWCGLRDAQMRELGANAEAQATRGQRYWAFLSCPRCGGAITVEHTPPSHAADILQVVPEPTGMQRVQHLPPDVEEYYQGAIRVLDAGVPDASAVQLRR